MQSLLSQEKLQLSIPKDVKYIVFSAAKLVLSTISGYMYLTDLFKEQYPSPSSRPQELKNVTYFQNSHYAKILIYCWVQLPCFYFLTYCQQLDTGIK